MDLSTGRRTGYDIDSLLSPSPSNTAADDVRKPIIRDSDNFATFIPGNVTAAHFTLR